MAQNKDLTLTADDYRRIANVMRQTAANYRLYKKFMNQTDGIALPCAEDYAREAEEEAQRCYALAYKALLKASEIASGNPT